MPIKFRVMKWRVEMKFFKRAFDDKTRQNALERPKYIKFHFTKF